MSTTAKLMIGATASVLAALLCWLAWRPAAVGHAGPSARLVPGASASAGTRDLPSSDGRTLVPAPAASVAALTCDVRSKDAAGPPIGGALVALAVRWQDAEQDEPRAKLIRLASSAADGRVRFELAPSDLPLASQPAPRSLSLVVLATAAGHAAGEVDLAWEREQTATLVLEPGRFLVGRVVDAATREPLAADVRLGWGEPDRPQTQAFTREDGSFSLPAWDQRHLIAFAADHIPGGRLIDGDAPAAPLEIALERDLLTQPFDVIVLRAHGEPDPDVFRILFQPAGEHHAPPSGALFVAAAELRLRSIHGAYNGTDLVIADGHEHRADRDQRTGRFRGRCLDPGTYRVWAMMADTKIPLGEVELPPALGRLELRLPELAGIEGRIVGERSSDCRVQVWRGAQLLVAARVMSDGSFRALGLPPRAELRLDVRCGERSEAWIEHLTLAAGEVRSGLQLAPRFERSPDGDPTPPLYLELVVRDLIDRRPMAGVRASDGRGTVVTADAPGRCRLPGSASEVTLEQPGYLRLHRDRRDLAPSNELLLVPTDRERLLASGRFTWVEIDVAPASGSSADGQLTFLAADARTDSGWTLLDAAMLPELERTASGWSGWMPSPARIDAGSDVALPDRLGVRLVPHGASAIGSGAASVLRGGITAIELTMNEAGEITWQVRDAFTGNRHDEHDVDVQFFGPPWIKPWRDASGNFVARAVPVGRHRPQVMLREREVGRVRRCQVRPEAVDVRAGKNAPEQLTLIETVCVPIEVTRSDGSEWLPPEPVRRANGEWVTAVGPHAPRVIAVPAQQMIGTEPFPSAVLSAEAEPVAAGSACPPRARYALLLLLGETVTLTVADGEVAAAPQTMRVTADMAPISLRLER